MVNGISYTVEGLKTITLRYQEYGCDTSYTDTLRVYKEVKSVIDTITTGCKKFIANFTNSSLNPLSYFWDFGVQNSLSDTSNQSSPVYTYQDSGVYTVSLIVKGESTCADTSSRTIRIFPILSPFFKVPDNQCFKNNSVDFAAGGVLFNTTRIDWSFGANASKLISSARNENGIIYSQSGLKNISLRYRDFGCDTTFDTTFTIYKEINAGFNINREVVCFGDEIPIQFISTTDSLLDFRWNFGDGNTSIAKSPLHVYSTPGFYSLTFIASDVNCADTFILPSKISVLPSPTADFSPLNITVPSYAAEVIFTNKSLNFTQSNFNPGEDRSVSPFTNFTYEFNQDGYYYPTLFVENELGCADSITGKVFIKSEFYVPNTFTPNGDGLNELFIPILTAPTNYTLLIFNKWGEVIFETNEVATGWDGTLKNGKLAKTDSYVYKLYFSYSQGEVHEIFGHVNLLR